MSAKYTFIYIFETSLYLILPFVFVSSSESPLLYKNYSFSCFIKVIIFIFSLKFFILYINCIKQNNPKIILFRKYIIILFLLFYCLNFVFNVIFSIFIHLSIIYIVYYMYIYTITLFSSGESYISKKSRGSVHNSSVIAATSIRINYARLCDGSNGYTFSGYILVNVGSCKSLLFNI